MSDIYLRYVGKDKGIILGVPARNLTREEAEIHGVNRLIDSRLYEFTERQQDIVLDFDQDYEKPKRIRKSKEFE